MPKMILIRLPRVASTQDWARAWANVGAPEGLAVQALEQTAGRGRLARSWWSPAGSGLFISVLLRPHIPVAQASQLTMLVSLAAIDACRAVAGVEPHPKWPNDLLLDGRKLAGVLTEVEQHEGWLSHAIIGLGLNVNTRFADTELAQTAISLAEAAERRFEVAAVCDAYLAALAARYERFRAGESPLAAWRARLQPLGQRVSVEQTGQPGLRGLAFDVNETGALLVRDDDDRIHTIWAGDIVPLSDLSI